jgi:hypothetical protein
MIDDKPQMKETSIPKWLRYIMILLAVLYLVGVMVKKGGPPRDDFPARIR